MTTESAPRPSLQSRNLLGLERFHHGDVREWSLFRALDGDCSGHLAPREVLEILRGCGFAKGDPRLGELIEALERYPYDALISYEEMGPLIRPYILLVERALQGRLVIPDFESFREQMTEMYKAAQQNRAGKVADYIPQLARVDPDQQGLALCTVDGQQLSLGRADAAFCVQSTCKTLSYCLALEQHGPEYVHRFVGREPSGRGFNELSLNQDGRPHNPMINAGAIMTTSMIRPELDISDRFQFVMDAWKSLCGNSAPSFDNAVYLSERQTADRNFALGYFMREQGGFPEGTNLLETLEFYFQCCSISMNANQMSVAAATLANGGVCPSTGERVISAETVQNCLSLMYSCGMYDFSGEWAFTVGLPAKSGVGGAIMVVVPNVLGLCTWSPRLDDHGNSVFGVDLCKRLVGRYNFHHYDSLTGLSAKTDPRTTSLEMEAERIDGIIWAASKGDIGAMQKQLVRGLDVNARDYDGRSALHLAAAEGRTKAVRFLLEHNARPNAEDRWGGTPLGDARRHGHSEAEAVLLEYGATDQDGRSDEVLESGTADLAASDTSVSTIEMIYAASRGDLRGMQRLIARGIAADGADYDLRTPLHLAAAEGHLTAVRWLVCQGADLDARDRWGGTPLDDARRHRREDVVQFLESLRHPASRRAASQPQD